MLEIVKLLESFCSKTKNVTGRDFSNPTVLPRLSDNNRMDSQAWLSFTSLLLGSGSVNGRSVSEGKQIQQGLGRDKVEVKTDGSKKKKKKTGIAKTLGTKAGMLSTETKDELATDRWNTGTIYTHTGGTGESNQGGDRQSRWRMNPQGQGEEIWNQRKGKYSKLGRCKAINQSETWHVCPQPTFTRSPGHISPLSALSIMIVFLYRAAHIFL